MEQNRAVGADAQPKSGAMLGTPIGVPRVDLIAIVKDREWATVVL